MLGERCDGVWVSLPAHTPRLRRKLEGHKLFLDSIAQVRGYFNLIRIV